MDTQVRFYKTLPEVRRVLRKLTDLNNADEKRLATFRRAFNVSCLLNEPDTLNSIAALAAPFPRRKVSTKHANDEDGSLDLGDYSFDDKEVPVKKPTRAQRNVEMLKDKPAPKRNAKSPPAKVSKAKAPANPPKKSDEEITNVRGGGARGRNTGNSNDVVNVRGGPGSGAKSTKQALEADQALTPAARKSIATLSKTLNEKHSQMQIAQNIHATLLHNFPHEVDNTSKRSLNATSELLKQQQTLFIEARKLMHSVGDKYFTASFKKYIDDVEKLAEDRFAADYESISVQYAMATGELKGKAATFFIAYITMHELQTLNGTHDCIIVLTQVLSLGLGSDAIAPEMLPSRGKNQKAIKAVRDAQPQPVLQNYLRVLTEYRPPAFIVHSMNNLKPCGDSPEYAFHLVLHSLMMDRDIAALHPVKPPLKDGELKFTHPLVERARVDMEDGRLRVYLKKATTMAKAHEEFSNIAADLKLIMRQLPDRGRPTAKALPPKTINTMVVTKAGAKIKEPRIVIDFVFSAKDAEDPTKIPNDELLRKAARDAGLDEGDSTTDFIRGVKQAMGQGRK